MDKLLHFFVGGGLVILAQAAGMHGAVRYIAPVVMGAGKEVYDAKSYHGPMAEHVWDFTATMAGALAAGISMDHSPVPPRVSLAPACDSASFGQWLARKAAADRAGVQRATGRCPQ